MALELILLALLFASLVSSVTAVRYYNAVLVVVVLYGFDRIKAQA